MRCRYTLHPQQHCFLFRHRHARSPPTLPVRVWAPAVDRSTAPARSVCSRHRCLAGGVPARIAARCCASCPCSGCSCTARSSLARSVLAHSAARRAALPSPVWWHAAQRVVQRVTAVALLLGSLRTCCARVPARKSVLLCDLLVVLPPPGAMSLCELLPHPVALLGAQCCEEQERSFLVCSRSASKRTAPSLVQKPNFVLQTPKIIVAVELQ